MRAEDAITLSPGTWVAQLRQLQSGVTQLITTIEHEQINPEPRLELLSQTLAGRFSLAMQQALVATERTGETGSLELFSELGAEAPRSTASPARWYQRGGGGVAAHRERPAVPHDPHRRHGPRRRHRLCRLRQHHQHAAGRHRRRARGRGRRGARRRPCQRGDHPGRPGRGDPARAAHLPSAAQPDPPGPQGALEVAHERLPAAVAHPRGEEPGEITPIDVTTKEEIGQLARAVDDMHRQAVVLATGEARLRSQVSQMFVTLSRRNTSLINQQLGLIERLERDEEDPKRLESLFRLDHLAARMRRTADSLLILADAPTATAGIDGLTVSDALQAATSGVQDYQRVRIRSANPMRINDSAAADLVHLLTELVDNA
jgi:hypothetical protein